MNPVKYELIGIAGTLLILIGFCSNSEKRIRLFDMAGSVLFVLYGVLIRAYSNIILNGILILVHIIKLYKMGAKHEESGLEKQNKESLSRGGDIQGVL